MTAPPIAAAPRPAASPARGTRAAAAAGLAAAVLLFWWGVTGVLLALQRSAGTRVLALVLALAAAAAGVWLTRRVRRAVVTAGGVAGADRPAAGTAADAARAVLAGALLWTAVSAAFYGGWVVGPALAAPAGAATLARAAHAVGATAYSTALAAALLGAAWRLARAPGRGPGGAAAFAPATFATLWAAHELAKLNVFFGVANPGAELLPPYLAALRGYFGPARNSPLLAVSVAALVAATAAAAGAAGRTRAPARRAGLALLAGVLALAALEHALLGAGAPVTWWDGFLRLRGAP